MDCIYKYWLSLNETQVISLYNFGEVPIVPTVLEKCRDRCKYLQYRHVSFSYSEY